MAVRNFPKFVRDNYEIHEWRHASAVLRTDFREEWQDIVDVLTEFRVRRSHIIVGGGGRSQVSASIDRAFTSRDWAERKFATQIRVDQNVYDSRHIKSIALKTASELNVNGTNEAQFLSRDMNEVDLRMRSR